MISLLIFGPPGSGKGTQSVKLAEKFNLIHLSTGDLLRAEISGETTLGKKVSSIMSKGELVPDEIVIEMIAGNVDAGKAKAKAGFIFDGFPRTVDQAHALEDMLKERGLEINRMLVLDVEHNQLVERLLSRAAVSGRADDQDVSVIENRIEVYKAKTEPIIDYYRKVGKYVPVNGMGSIEDIFDRLSTQITKCL